MTKKSHKWQIEHREEYNKYARERDKNPKIREQKRPRRCLKPG
jgi:hypothetical protein